MATTISASTPYTNGFRPRDFFVVVGGRGVRSGPVVTSMPELHPSTFLRRHLSRQVPPTNDHPRRVRGQHAEHEHPAGDDITPIAHASASAASARRSSIAISRPCCSTSSSSHARRKRCSSSHANTTTNTHMLRNRVNNIEPLICVCRLIVAVWCRLRH